MAGAGEMRFKLGVNWSRYILILRTADEVRERRWRTAVIISLFPRPKSKPVVQTDLDPGLLGGGTCT